MLYLKAACDALGLKRGDAFRMSSRTMLRVLDKSMHEWWGGGPRPLLAALISASSMLVVSYRVGR